MKSIFDDFSGNNDNNTSSKYKYCQYCGTTIPFNLDSDYCNNCRDIILFQEVKDFIREHDVTEFQVAEHFGLPLRIVKGWIKEGRIEYKETTIGAKALNNHLKCEHCGASITFGSLCPKCLKLLNNNVKGYGMQLPQGDDRMFYLDENNTRGSKK